VRVPPGSLKKVLSMDVEVAGGDRAPLVKTVPFGNVWRICPSVHE